MEENKIELKPIRSISELLRENFFIPSYQRGYRWTTQQVRDLLDDVWNFIESEHDKEEWYCLQPVVVKPKNGSWEVIDGQQRLTTIFLILKHLGKFVESKRKTFELEYETRNTEEISSRDFLQDIESKTEQDALTNIDYFHIYAAFTTIEQWFKKRAESHSSISSKFITPFLEKTKVIWYETSEEDAVKIFTRINMGKIPLTNAELIKALFLNSFNFKGNDNNDERIRLKQLEIASEWDSIEYSLHDDEFWWFINKDNNEKETRIEFLFELIVGNHATDEYHTFREYYKKFKTKNEKEIENNWKEVKRHFQILQDWLVNRELYHKIGFLVTIGGSIKDLIEKSHKKKKSEFIELINNKIANQFKGTNLSEIEYGNENVKPLLLLHNIQTMLNNSEENSRFPFNRYKKEKWDIEHIHAIATEIPTAEQHRKDWLEQAKEFLNTKEDKDLALLQEISQYSKDGFEQLFHKILNHFSENGTHEEINDLSNLALLDEGTNRGYKNAVFPVKRKTIIEKEKEGTFVPICTKNVFMKYYSDKIAQMTFWGESDRNAYIANIKEVLQDYLPNQEA
jgi:uncharacterized protein with ParB-like and HNH nuclease domain